jgi:hypothetical protein
VLEKEFVRLGFKTELDSKLKSTNTLVFIYHTLGYPDFLRKDLKNG